MVRNNMPNTLVEVIEFIMNFIKSIVKWLLNCLDTLAIIFTYLSILALTVLLVKSSLQGLVLTPIISSLSIFTLMKVNKNLRGGN